MQNARMVEVVEELLARAGIDGPPVDLDRVASVQGVRDVQEASLGPVLGSTEGHGQGFKIRLNSDVPLKRRFTYAHEIGHTVLMPFKANAVSANSERIYHRTSSQGDSLERLCDRFAAEILMPRKWFGPMAKSSWATLSTITHLAELFDTSIQSAAVRFTQLAERRLGIVVWKAAGGSPTFGWSAGIRLLTRWAAQPESQGGFVRALHHADRCDHAVLWQGPVQNEQPLFTESRAFGNGAGRYLLTLVKTPYSKSAFQLLVRRAHRSCLVAAA